MKLELLQENLKLALAVAGRVAPSRATLPVLGNVLLKATEAGLQVSACDLTTSITVLVGGKVEEIGAITLPAKRMTEVVGLMPQERMSITLDDKTLTATLKGGKARTSIKGMDAQEFPIIPTLDSAVELLTLPASALLKAFKAVSFAMLDDTTRPSLHATFINLSGACAKFAASDGFRLAEFSLPVTYSGDDKTLLIDAVSVGHIERVLSELAKSAADVTVGVSKSNGQVIIGNDKMQIVAQLVDQEYVDYERIIPRKFTTTATVGVADLKLAIRQAATVIDGGLGVALDFERDDAGEPLLIVNGKGDEVGAADSRVDIVFEGPQSTVHLNPDYVLPVLDALDSVQCKVCMNGPRSPVLIRAVGDDAVLYVVMPLDVSKRK